MDAGSLSPLGLGLLLGLAHSLDADHLAAVAAMVSSERSLGRSALIGAWWGLGHTAALALVGCALIGLRLAVPPGLAAALEGLVGVMLVFLGGRLLWSSGSATLHSHAHGHASEEHLHLHVHEGAAVHASDPHAHPGSVGRPFWVGVVHGLAGSAAIILVLLPGIPSAGLAVLTLALFSAGTIAGMAAMTAAMGLPFNLLEQRFPSLQRALRLLTGAASAAFGATLVWEALSALLPGPGRV